LRYDDETASGTGFFIDSRDGLVLTNNHVIRGATSVTVTIPATNQTYQAQIVGTDLAADIAVLRITPPRGTVSAPIGDSATVATRTAAHPVPPPARGGRLRARGGAHELGTQNGKWVVHRSPPRLVRSAASPRETRFRATCSEQRRSDAIVV
jgi:hypothetical protein